MHLQAHVHLQAHEPLTTSMLAAAPPMDQKQLLGAPGSSLCIAGGGSAVNPLCLSDAQGSDCTQ